MRSMNDVITLVCESNEPGPNGLPVNQQMNSMEVFAEICSIKRNEFYAAAREGIKLALSVYVNPGDFEEAIVTVEGKKYAPNKAVYENQTYSIYRTYQESDAELELILQEVQ